MRAVECRQCGLCFISPRPKTEFIPRLYEDDYFTKIRVKANFLEYGYVDYFSETNKRSLIRSARQRLAIATNYLVLKNRSCLEIGCATGELCQLLSQRGAKPVGLDLSAAAIEKATIRYGDLDFRQGDVSILSNDERFDAIFGFEVIEHVTSPKDFIARLALHLNPGGFLILTTPNYECGRRIGFERWSGFMTSFEHLYFFSPETLSRYMEDQNLSVVDWFTDKGSGNVHLHTNTGTLRNMTKTFLSRLRLLDMSLMVSDWLRSRRPCNKKEKDGHNLYMVISNA